MQKTIRLLDGNHTDCGGFMLDLAYPHRPTLRFILREYDEVALQGYQLQTWSPAAGTWQAADIPVLRAMSHE